MSATPPPKRTSKKAGPDLKGELTTTAKPKQAKPEAGAPEASTATAADATADATGAKRAKVGKARAPKEAKPKGPKYPGPVLRLLLPMSAYSANKDAIKAALKEEAMSFQHLGRGQGRYYNETVQVFAKWGDRDADYTLRGDAVVVEKLAGILKGMGATDFTEEAKAQEEAAEVTAWKLEKPAPRPGEPEFFLKKRLAEWEARDPRKAG